VCEARTGQRVGKIKGFLRRLCALSWKTRPASVDEPMTTKTIAANQGNRSDKDAATTGVAMDWVAGPILLILMFLHHFLSIFIYLRIHEFRVMLILI